MKIKEPRKEECQIFRGLAPELQKEKVTQQKNSFGDDTPRHTNRPSWEFLSGQPTNSRST